MANNYAQGLFTPKHPEKYVGRGFIHFRSSWEFAFMTFCDNHPSILQWSSESVIIPYKNPLTGKNSRYTPDFFIIYQDASGQNHAEIIEIKPGKETTMEAAKTIRDRAAAAVNMAKWQAARAWCSDKGIVFRVVTERDLFVGGKR